MANFIEKTDLSSKRFVTALSRYDGSDVYFYGDERKLTLGTYERHDFPESSADKYLVLSPGYEFRPDLLAWDAYGTTELWWVLLEANNIADIFDFKAGINIRIPANALGERRL